MSYCKMCGAVDCKKHGFVLGKVREVKDFSGSSPPEVFVGRWGYPNVYVGILSPEKHGDTRVMSSAEEWHARNLEIPRILRFRNELIYGRTTGNIKKTARVGNKFSRVMQEIAMTHKSVSTEFNLKKPVKRHDERDTRVPLISNAAPVSSVKLQENTKIKKKVDYIVNDKDVKSVDAMLELERGGVGNSNIVKLLSAGLLGLRKNRTLVPTRWSITATDDTLSKKKLERIKYYPEIQDYRVFSGEYLGNHYEILLIPRYWSFEVIEISMKNFGVWRDFESVFKRKKYAADVTGAYYANRLGVTEYLDSVKKQAAVLVLREIRPEYYAPLGVGILREVTRGAMSGKYRRFDNLQDAFADIQRRLRISISHFLKNSQMVKELRQRTLRDWA